jgi:hypothetical protein
MRLVLHGRWCATPQRIARDRTIAVRGPVRPKATTMPLLAKGLLRLLGLQPLVTTSSGAVAHGAMMPPGHMQKLYTPVPSTCCTTL